MPAPRPPRPWQVRAAPATSRRPPPRPLAELDPRLPAFREQPGALIATDFDGTLSPIVDDPGAAVLVEGAADVLVQLSSVVDELAVISGRPLAYLDARLPPGMTMVGLYGLETVRDGERVDHPDAPQWRAVVAEVVALAERTGPEGLHVESKDLSLTLHYRQHPELADRVGQLAHELAGPSGLRVHPAKMSVELHPPIDEDKGTALTRLASGHDGPVMFLGDDVGDLTAFDALDRLAARGRQVLRVVAGSDETDPRVRDRADLVVDGPPGVLDLLASLLD